MNTASFSAGILFLSFFLSHLHICKNEKETGCISLHGDATIDNVTLTKQSSFI